MASRAHHVTRTRKESTSYGGDHRHIAALCPAGEPSVAKATAIAQIRAGTDSYYTTGGGQTAAVEVVDRCARCGASYLRTNRDTTVKDNLLELPDC